VSDISKWKTYATWTIGSNDVRDALGARSTQIHVFVAAPSAVAAARVMGVSSSHLSTYGGETGNAAEISLANTAPGQVFATKNNTLGRDPIKVTLRNGNPLEEMLVPGTNGPEWIVECRNAHLKAAVERKNRKVLAETKRREESARQRQNKQSDAEVLERIKPMLIEMGIHHDTVKQDRWSGINLPGEVLERLVKQAYEFEINVMGGEG